VTFMRLLGCPCISCNNCTVQRHFEKPKDFNAWWETTGLIRAEQRRLCLFRFCSNLVGEEGPRIPGVKDSSVCCLKTLSAPLTFFRFLRCLFLVYSIHLFQLNLNPLLIISAFHIRKQNHKICKAS